MVGAEISFINLFSKKIRFFYADFSYRLVWVFVSAWTLK